MSNFIQPTGEDLYKIISDPFRVPLPMDVWTRVFHHLEFKSLYSCMLAYPDFKWIIRNNHTTLPIFDPERPIPIKYTIKDPEDVQFNPVFKRAQFDWSENKPQLMAPDIFDDETGQEWLYMHEYPFRASPFTSPMVTELVLFFDGKNAEQYVHHAGGIRSGQIVNILNEFAKMISEKGKAAQWKGFDLDATFVDKLGRLRMIVKRMK